MPNLRQCRMSVAENIRKLIAFKQTTASAVSKKAGLPRDAVRDILIGKSKNPRADTILKIAQALEVDPANLMGEEELAALIYQEERKVAEEQNNGEIFLPIRYEVAAGQWQTVDDLRDEPYGYAPAQRIKPYEQFPQWLERIVGDSVNKLIPDGSLVHVVDAIAIHYEPRHDDLVVVQRSRAQGSFLERSIKQVELHPSKIELWPRSYNPRWDGPFIVATGEEGDGDESIEIVGLVLRAYMHFR